MERKPFRIDRYTELQPQGGNQFTPRVGKYRILEINESPVHLPRATVVWVEDVQKSFESVLRTISLLPLELGVTRNKTFDAQALVQKVIIINGHVEAKYTHNGKEYNVIKCRWYTRPEGIQRVEDIELAGDTKGTILNVGPNIDPDIDPWFDHSED